MTDRGRVLLADDEETFLNSTADLLRREGYDCTTVDSGDAALARISDHEYDLLITDLEMPGNTDLQLVRLIAEKSGGLPVIILTGYPSVRSAVSCIELPVAAYLTKPVEFDRLLEKVDGAVARFRYFQAMRRTEERLKDWEREFAHLTPTSTAPPQSQVDTFLALTLRNVMGSLSDLQQLSRALSNQQVSASPCQLMNCPRGAQLQQAVKETIEVLEETKGAFKSKTLGQLRSKLELLLDHV
jgi:DNA-binding response OmpR family regulator